LSDARIRVIAADDHPLYREALAEAITACDRIELLEICSDGRAALDAIRRHAPDVAVIDMKMPKLDGRYVAERVQELNLATRVLFVSEYNDGELVLAALTAGAAGYLSKSATATEISDAIVAISEGAAVLPPSVRDELVSTLHEHGHPDPRLSEREASVLKLIADGYSTKEIAEELHIAVPTAKTHTQNLYAKLGVNGRGAAVAAAMRRGLLD
jgi:two-component system, NarL family, nitrate/nitrite response regulator NarL